MLLGCVFSTQFACPVRCVSSCVPLMTGSRAENNKNQIPLLLLWKTGTKTWRQAFNSEGDPSKQGGRRKREGPHKCITKVTRWVQAG